MNMYLIFSLFWFSLKLTSKSIILVSNQVVHSVTILNFALSCGKQLSHRAEDRTSFNSHLCLFVNSYVGLVLF